MRHDYIRIATDVHAVWFGTPPVYRLFINDELMAERVYIWKQQYLEEHIQLDVPPGKYDLRLETVATVPTFTATDTLPASQQRAAYNLMDYVREEVLEQERAYLRKLGVGDEQLDFFLQSRTEQITKECELKYTWHQQQEQQSKVWFENTRVLHGSASIKSGHLIRVHPNENT